MVVDVLTKSYMTSEIRVKRRNDYYGFIYYTSFYFAEPYPNLIIAGLNTMSYASFIPRSSGRIGPPASIF